MIQFNAFFFLLLEMGNKERKKNPINSSKKPS